MNRQSRDALRGALAAGFLFFVLVLSAGHAMALDSGSDTGGGPVNAVVSNAAPVVTRFDIRTTGNISLMGSQLDVRTTYWFWVTVYDANNWSDIKQLDVNVWYDGGSGSELSYYAQTAGANYRVNLTYANSGVNAPTTGQWTLQSGNVNFTAANIAIGSNVANQNYSFRIPFELRSQIRQANDPVNLGAGAGYDDLGSWNAQFVALDNAANNVTQRQNETSLVAYEFGVFRYTDVAIGGSWDGLSSVAPGASVDTASRSVAYSSNGPYKLRVYFTSNFTDGTDTFGASQVTLKQTGGMGSAQTFAGTTITNAIYVFGSSGSFYAHSVGTNADSVAIQFTIAVPLGTPAGNYQANVVVRIDEA